VIKKAIMQSRMFTNTSRPAVPFGSESSSLVSSKDPLPGHDRRNVIDEFRRGGSLTGKSVVISEHMSLFPRYLLLTRVLNWSQELNPSQERTE
jgi:hypothetical protein